MSRPAATLLSCSRSCLRSMRQRPLAWTRTFSQSTPAAIDQTDDASLRLSRSLNLNSSAQANLAQPSRPTHQSADSTVASILGNLRGLQRDNQKIDASGLEGLQPNDEGEDGSREPYHFHIYSHKHNTHVTVSKPNRDAIISLSCGNLGFKKSGRKHYDSAYQLGAYVIDKLHQQGWHKKIARSAGGMEVVLRGFGPGREAVTKVLLGNEGRYLRSYITRVADATRLKFGGTRSKKPRRLG